MDGPMDGRTDGWTDRPSYSRGEILVQWKSATSVSVGPKVFSFDFFISGYANKWFLKGNLRRGRLSPPGRRGAGSDGFVNAICHFPTYTPLQPKRVIIKTWNLAWTVILCLIVGPSRRFLISCPKAEIWGRGGGTPGGAKMSKKFFRFFSFFHLGYLV